MAASLSDVLSLPMLDVDVDMGAELEAVNDSELVVFTPGTLSTTFAALEQEGSVDGAHDALNMGDYDLEPGTMAGASNRASTSQQDDTLLAGSMNLDGIAGIDDLVLEAELPGDSQTTQFHLDAATMNAHAALYSESAHTSPTLEHEQASSVFSDEDSGHASDHSSGSEALSSAAGHFAVRLGEDEVDATVEAEVCVPRAGKRELAKRPFAKRSKPNFYEDMTAEERRLVEREGFKLPKDRALTKAEEKELKKVRRKVKNKISAQDSRKRRKEYLSQLEDKVKSAMTNNRSLKTRVSSLERQNSNLMEQINQLHARLAHATGGGSATAGTALMLVGLCFSLLFPADLVGSGGLELGGPTPFQPFAPTTDSVKGFQARTLAFGPGPAGLMDLDGDGDADYVRHPGSHASPVPPASSAQSAADERLARTVIDELGQAIAAMNTAPSTEASMEHLHTAFHNINRSAELDENTEEAQDLPTPTASEAVPMIAVGQASAQA